jgi:hypothetical protein
MTDMATRKTATATKAPAKAAKATPAKAKAAAAPPVKAPRESIEYGSAWLVEHVNTQAGTSYSASALRILLRKLTKDGVLERDSEGRQRYNFPKGAKDPQVVAIVKAVKSGAGEKAKQERLDALKEQRAASKGKAKAAPAKKARSKKVVEVEEEDDDDLEIDDDI